MEYSRKRGVSTPQIYLSNQTLVRLQLKLTSFYDMQLPFYFFCCSVSDNGYMM